MDIDIRKPVAHVGIDTQYALQIHVCLHGGGDGIQLYPAVLGDRGDTRRKTTRESHQQVFRRCDAVITSGGAWTGDHDLVAKVLEDMGGETLFHRLRIGPGKATGLALVHSKPVFILPGGPPSNLMGFLQIALPGLCILSGMTPHPLKKSTARLKESLRTRFSDWTQFIYGCLENTGPDGIPFFAPILRNSRLRSMAEAEAVAALPEGITELEEGSLIQIQLLT